MATEKRLIDANKLENLVEKSRAAYFHRDDILAAIVAQPTVDAVEVVRCRDCRFCKEHPTSDKVKLCTNENWNTEYHPFAYDEGFCSYGERKE